MNFYKHWIGDYQRDTADLSLIEHGAYRLLLDAYYACTGELPGELVRLFRIARASTPEEQEAVRVVADRFFPLTSTGIRRNNRADREIEDARMRAHTAAENGRKGGRPPNPRETPRDTERDTQWDTQRVTQSVSETQRVTQRVSGWDASGHPSGNTSHSHSQSHSQNSQNQSRSRRSGDAAPALTGFFHPDMQDAYHAMWADVPNGAAFDATLRAEQQGLHGQPATWEALGRALHDLWSNGQGWNARLFRGYLRRQGEAVPSTTTRAGAVDWAQITRELEVEERAAGRAP